MKLNRNTNKQFKRGCIYFNEATNRPERVLTITADTIGTRAAGEVAIETHPRGVFRSPTPAEIEAFVGGTPKFAKSAMTITDAAQTALAYGDKVMVLANTDPRLPQIEAAVRTGNNRALGQLVSDRATKRVALKMVEKHINNK